jgi:putative tricarboxylic transport membrane protein
MRENSDRKESSRFELIVPMKPAVLIATALILAWLAFMAYETTNMLPPILPGYPGDSFFPRLVIIFAVMCAVIVLLKGVYLPRGAQLAAGEDTSFPLRWLDFVSVCVLVAAYGELLEPIGFEILTFVLLTVILAPRIAVGGLGIARSIVYAAGAALLTTLVFYVAFGLLLRVPLPLLFLPRYIQY